MCSLERSPALVTEPRQAAVAAVAAVVAAVAGAGDGVVGMI